MVQSKEFHGPIIFQEYILRVCMSMGGGGAIEQRGAIFPLGPPCGSSARPPLALLILKY